MKLPLRRRVVRPSRFVSILGLLLAAPLLSQGEQQQAVAAGIDSVQVYSDQAVVTRRVQLRIHAGQNVLRINELTPQLDDSSVRVAFDRNDLRIQEVAVRSAFRERFLSDEARQAEERLKTAESNLRRLTDRYAALKKEAQQLSQLEVARVPEDPEDPAWRAPVDSGRWTRTLDFIQNSLRENQAAVSELLGSIDLAREELLVAIAVADRYHDARNIESKQVSIAIECAPERCDASRPVQLELRYTVGGVAWFPIYTARVDSSGSQTHMQLSSYALLKNQSGEDWDNVRLRFSAADPRESGDLAQLPTWRIQQRVVADDLERESGRSGRRQDSPAVSSGAVASTAPMQPAPEAAADEAIDSFADGQAGNGPGGGGYGSLQSQRNRSNAYFMENRRLVQEEQANQRNEAAGNALRGIQSSVQARDQAVTRDDFQGALVQSEAIIERVRSLDPRYQGLFAEDLRRSLETRRMALNMLELQGMMRSLTPPSSSARGFDVAYQAPGRDSAPSEPGFTRILLESRELPLTLSYEAAPERRELAFLVGRAANSAGGPLLAGPAAIFHNRDYVGEASIATVGPAAEFPVHLGAVDDIRIQRHVTDQREDGGLISTQRILRREVQIKIHNQKRNNIQLDLFERLPVSSDERIRISAPEFSEAPAERKEEYGLIRYRLSLRAGEQKTITIRYEIRHPADVLPAEAEGGAPQW
ncbi:MAG: DUF4139 domain-containing protein [Leptospirales bacterium]|nr:DUF4139 domain-containing protein [Leptospirales bacterium]